MQHIDIILSLSLSLSAGYGKQISGSFFIFAQEVSHAAAG